jgi:hypothetical protein
MNPALRWYQMSHYSLHILTGTSGLKEKNNCRHERDGQGEEMKRRKVLNALKANILCVILKVSNREPLNSGNALYHLGQNHLSSRILFKDVNLNNVTHMTPARQRIGKQGLKAGIAAEAEVNWLGYGTCFR